MCPNPQEPADLPQWKNSFFYAVNLWNSPTFLWGHTLVYSISVKQIKVLYITASCVLRVSLIVSLGFLMYGTYENKGFHWLVFPWNFCFYRKFIRIRGCSAFAHKFKDKIWMEKFQKENLQRKSCLFWG